MNALGQTKSVRDWLREPAALRLGNGGFVRGAHHPHCARHTNHLLWILGRPLCLGCTCLYSGAALGVVLAFSPNVSAIHWLVWCVVHATCVLPTAAQPWIQHKWYKVAARTLVGVAAGSFWVGLLFRVDFPAPHMLSVAVLGGAFVAIVQLQLWLRRRDTECPA